MTTDTATIGHNNPPAPITPETLVNLETLPQLLADNYGPLAARGAQLAADMGAWIEAHRELPPAGWDASRPYPFRLTIADDADNLRSADFFNLIAAWSGGKTEGSGEVDEARKKVKFSPFQACKAIDGFFNGMRADLRASLLAGFQAQDRYINDKIIYERRERERVAALERQRADQALADGLKLNLPWADIRANVNAIPGPIVTRAATVARSRCLGMARSMPFVAAPRPKAPRKPRVKKSRITPWTPERVAALYAGHAAHKSAQAVVSTLQAMAGLPLTPKAVRSKAQHLRLLWQRRAIVRVKIVKVPVARVAKVSRIIQRAAIPIPEPVYVAPLVEPLPGPDGIVAAPLEYVMNFCAVHGIADQWLDMDRVNKVRKWLKMPPMVIDCTAGASV